MDSKHKFTSIDEYISSMPAKTQKRLKEMRKVIRKAAPEAEECISYNMPAFRQNGMLCYFAGFTAHYSLFPTGRGVEAFIDKLGEYETSKGTIKFPMEMEVPKDLVTEIVRFRVSENRSKKN